MVRFDPADAFDDEKPDAELRVDAPMAALRRLARETLEPSREPPNQLLERVFPHWARLVSQRTENPDAAFGADVARGAANSCAADVSSGAGNIRAAFAAGASLALLDQALRANPPFAGVLRQRLALRAASACARIARHREDESALRDAEHLAPAVGETLTSPAGRIHRLWRSFAARPVRFDRTSLRSAADLLELPQVLDLESLVGALQTVVRSAENPLTAAARAASTILRALAGAPGADAEILALWLGDLVLANRLGWAAPIPLVATAIAHPSVRSESGRRPRPDDAGWPQSCARATALAAQDAYVMAGDLARRSERLLSVAPKLRAKGAGRVVALLLADDCVAAARAARASGLSDRAGRRLFDRLTELGVVREFSGRLSFRLYGL